MINQLRELVDKQWFTHLITEQDAEASETLSEYVQFSENFMIKHNLITDEKEYICSFRGGPTFQNSLEHVDKKFFDRIQTYLAVFKSDNFEEPDSELLFFDSTVLENSYDETQFVRECTKNIFKNYYSHNETFMNKCLNVFDGASLNFIDGIRIYRNKPFNSVLCYEVGDAELERDYARNLYTFTEVCKLYGFTQTEIDKAMLTVGPIAADFNTRFCFELPQSSESTISKELQLFLLPFDKTVYMESLQSTSQQLISQRLITEERRRDLMDWTNWEDRYLSHYSLSITASKGKVNVEPIAFYGIELRERVNPPYRCDVTLFES